MTSPGCFGNVLLIASFALAAGASAQEKEGQADASDFARPGFYVGVGGTYVFPNGWNSDLNDDLNEQATELANQRATDELALIAPGDIIPLDVRVDGADLEDGLLGINGVIGYRYADLVAFEVEGEWLIDSSKSNLDIDGSTGSHTAKVEDIWTLTTNVKVYPFTGRLQPFAVIGLGLQHSKLDIDVVTSDLTTTEDPPPTNPPTPPVHTVSADFRIKSSDTKLDGVVRLGGGIDIYATPNIVAAFSATYVAPFAEVGSMTTDYVAVGWRILYRF
ncbi:MAG: hypothetical protein V3S60_11320 [Acidimicrobiia bacterium]